MRQVIVESPDCNTAGMLVCLHGVFSHKKFLALAIALALLNTAYLQLVLL